MFAFYNSGVGGASTDIQYKGPTPFSREAIEGSGNIHVPLGIKTPPFQVWSGKSSGAGEEWVVRKLYQIKLDGQLELHVYKYSFARSEE